MASNIIITANVATQLSALAGTDNHWQEILKAIAYGKNFAVITNPTPETIAELSARRYDIVGNPGDTYVVVEWPKCRERQYYIQTNRGWIVGIDNGMPLLEWDLNKAVAHTKNEVITALQRLGTMTAHGIYKQTEHGLMLLKEGTKSENFS